MLENISGSKIHMRICAVYDAKNVITKSTVTNEYRDSKQDKLISVMNLKVVDRQKERPDMACHGHQETH